MAAKFTFSCIIIHIIQQCLCEVVSPITSWTQFTTPSLPFAMSSLMPCYDTNTQKIWLIGGQSSNEIWYYDITLNQIIQTQDVLPHSGTLVGQSYTQLNDKLYYTIVSDYTIHRFDCTTGLYDNDFQTNADTDFLYDKRDSPCMANDGRYIFLIGGVVGNLAGSQYQIYDTENDIWKGGQQMKASRARASCAISPDGNNLYVFTGSSNGQNPPVNIETTIEKLDISDKTNIDTVRANDWVLIQNYGTHFIMPENSYYARAVTFYDYIYIIGGRDYNGIPTKNIFLFDPVTDLLQTNGIVDLLSARSSPAIIVAQDRLYAFGGNTRNIPISTDLNTWERTNFIGTTAPTNYPTNVPTVYPIKQTNNPTNQYTVDSSSSDKRKKKKNHVT